MRRPSGYTIGVRQPFAIVFSSVGVGSLTPDEFKFSLGREMGSIKLGHTRMATLLGNVNMSLPQPFSFLLKFRSVLFGTYHHAQALSCDRIGVVATRDVRPALSTLIKQNLGTVRGANIDLKSLTPQTAALQRGASGAVLRAAMVLNAQPFAVARLVRARGLGGRAGASRDHCSSSSAPADARGQRGGGGEKRSGSSGQCGGGSGQCGGGSGQRADRRREQPGVRRSQPGRHPGHRASAGQPERGP